MFINSEDLSWLVWNGAWGLSLLICAVLLLSPKIRKTTNPMAWVLGLNLLAGLVWFGQYPLASLREAIFKNSDPGYAAAALSINGRSVFIHDPRTMRLAAYDCGLTYSAGLCEMPVSDMLRTGKLDFVEMDLGGQLVRYSIATHDLRCMDWNFDTPQNARDVPFILQDRWISPGLGVCVVQEPIDAVTASHDITTTQHTMPWPSTQTYISVALVSRATGDVIDQFDGWHGAHPYLRFDPPQSQPRRPIATLADLLMIPASQNQYDPTQDDILLAQLGINEDILLRAMASPYQTLRANTLWMACRDTVVNGLSDSTLASLTAQSVTVFSDDWTYPQDCHDWMR